MEQKQKLSLKKNPRKCKDLVTKHIGKHIILEPGDLGKDICSGNLEKYDGTFLQITNFKQHDCSLISILTNNSENYNPSSNESILYSLPTKEINKGLIGSIQLYDDIMKAREEATE